MGLYCPKGGECKSSTRGVKQAAGTLCGSGHPEQIARDSSEEETTCAGLLSSKREFQSTESQAAFNKCEILRETGADASSQSSEEDLENVQEFSQTEILPAADSKANRAQDGEQDPALLPG